MGDNIRHGSLDLKFLSRSELNVLAFACSTSKSNKEIASELFVQEKTVKYHLTSVFKKLGLRSRTDTIHAYYTRTLPEIVIIAIDAKSAILNSPKKSIVDDPLPTSKLSWSTEEENTKLRAQNHYLQESINKLRGQLASLALKWATSSFSVTRPSKSSWYFLTLKSRRPLQEFSGPRPQVAPGGLSVKCLSIPIRTIIL